MSDLLRRIALHNSQVELEALRAEGRGMLWENEQKVQRQEYPIYGESDFNALATKIRATKVQIDDAVELGRIR